MSNFINAETGKYSTKVKIASTGSYLPGNIVTNEELTQFPAVHLHLIAQKTGVRSRRFAAENQATSDLAFLAAQECLQKGDFSAKKLDMLVVATSSPDRIHPATATRVQELLGASNAFAFDINSVCSGGIFALSTADSFIRSGKCNNALVIGAEVYSRFLNPNDFSSFPYFGDGAGAVLLQRTESEEDGIIRCLLHTDGSGADVIQIPAGGSNKPGWKVENQADYFFKMNGKKVYEFAITHASEIISECLLISGIDKGQIQAVIAHQANINVLQEISSRTGISFDRFFVNLDKYGNMAAASVFIALDEAISNGFIQKGDLCLLVGFGGGLSWGTTLIRI